MRHHYLLAASLLACFAMAAKAERVAYLPMELTGTNQISEMKSGNRFTVYGAFAAENRRGASGDALRFDGYSTHAIGEIHAVSSSKGATIALWVAPETYPVIALDTPSDNKARIAGNLDTTLKEGWEIALGKTGKYSISIFSSGRLVTAEASDLLPRGEWSHIEATIDLDSRYLTLYRNGIPTGSARIGNSFSTGSAPVYLGKDATDSYTGPFLINTFNGLLDELEIFDEPLAEEDLFTSIPEALPDFTTDKFAHQSLRPLFHGMPSEGWTNETHGMIFSDGCYHVFFQKNANGPYMTRLHWGHIYSKDLINWHEDPIAIAPDNDFDIKGCWSGCVFSDREINGGAPTILYTGVDYGKARILEASAPNYDPTLTIWNKKTAPAIDGRPAGLCDDFRDPYFFRNGDDAFIIVGSSKDEKGVCTLHRRLPSGDWTNDGSTFFQASNTATMGRFWEMPNLTKMNDDKWLFTTTPLGLTDGVKTIYWTGTINSDGTFRPDYEQPRQVELISKDGYGLLSPTIYQHNGKTIVLGIVPDKLPGEENYKLGWAHTYSLPREWEIDAAGNLIQKPYEGLSAMRSTMSNLASNIDLSGEKLLLKAGNRVEILGLFEIGTVPFGFNFLKSASGQASITYTPTSRELTIDFTSLPRIVNDAWGGNSYNGIYSCTLPVDCVASGKLKMNIFIDGSILDIFVNERYASSIRVFPAESDSYSIEAFSKGGMTKAIQLQAWQLQSDNDPNGIDEIDFDGAPFAGPVNVYSITGQLIKKNVAAEESTTSLPKGIYIIGGRKVMVK